MSGSRPLKNCVLFTLFQPGTSLSSSILPSSSQQSLIQLNSSRHSFSPSNSSRQPQFQSTEQFASFQSSEQQCAEFPYIDQPPTQVKPTGLHRAQFQSVKQFTEIPFQPGYSAAETHACVPSGVTNTKL